MHDLLSELWVNVGRRYGDYSGGQSGFGDYEQYPEYGSFGGGSLAGGYQPDYRPYPDRPSSAQSPSERSESPSLNHPIRTTNSGIIRQIKWVIGILLLLLLLSTVYIIFVLLPDHHQLIMN